MSFKRSTHTFRLTPETVRAKVILTSEEFEVGTTQERMEKFRLLRTVAEQPDLTLVRGQDFEKSTMYRVGNTWCIEFEAVVADRQR